MDKKKKLRLARTRKLLKRNPYYLSYAKSIDSLNNIYITTKIAIQGLVALKEELNNDGPVKLEIKIPSVKGIEVIKETKKIKVIGILNKSIRFELFVNSLISAISITEFFLEEVIRKVLKKYPKKLSVNFDSKSKREIQDERLIDLKDILNASSLEGLIDAIINQKLSKLFYASPTDYFKYLKDAIQINLEQELVDNYVEIKATRNILVHNKGKVNDLYINKSGDKARVTEINQNIPITEEYFLKSIGILKKVVRDTYVCLSKEYLKMTEERDLYPSVI